jgi:hypothetical protein
MYKDNKQQYKDKREVAEQRWMAKYAPFLLRDDAISYDGNDAIVEAYTFLLECTSIGNQSLLTDDSAFKNATTIEVYDLVYMTYCTAKGIDTVSINTFGRLLATYGYSRTSTTRSGVSCKYYKGLHVMNHVDI